ncbi:metallothionein F [Haematobia irritans]|uniref:metallothionein F n=1 Tax=Haematobia irritans TaxID=7368 RepID=UPI003F507E1E
MPCKGCEKDCKCTTSKCDERCKCAKGNKCNCMSDGNEKDNAAAGSGETCCSKQTKSD